MKGWTRISLEINEKTARRSMASRKGKGRNSAAYLGAKKVEWKVAPSGGGFGVFRKITKK